MANPKNDAPCPCGSGTRLDECCGPIRFAPAERHTLADVEQAIRMLSIESQKPERQVDVHAAYEEFWGEWDGLTEDLEERDEQDALEACELRFAAWLYFDREVLPGCTLAGDVLARRGAKLTPGVQAALRKFDASYLVPYEVVALQANVGFVLAPIEGGPRLWIPEATAGEIEELGDVLVARVIRGARGERELFPDAFQLVSEAKAPLLAYLAGARAALTAEGIGFDERGLAKAVAPGLHQAWCAWLTASDEAPSEDAAEPPKA